MHVFASGEVEGSKYIVMEHLSGGTLAERLRHGAFKVPETIHIAAALASALAYSHDRGIIHRDLKPANVLFTSDGKPVLSDFGVAKSLANDTSVTRQVVVIGAPRYMAPEQAVGAPITDRADIYSLGLMIVEMLLAKAPPVGWRLGDTDLGKLLPGHVRGEPILIPEHPDQGPMDDQIRVAADRRGEMRVTVKIEPEMAIVLGGILGLGLGP